MPLSFFFFRQLRGSSSLRNGHSVFCLCPLSHHCSVTISFIFSIVWLLPPIFQLRLAPRMIKSWKDGVITAGRGCFVSWRLPGSDSWQLCGANPLWCTSQGAGVRGRQKPSHHCGSAVSNWCATLLTEGKGEQGTGWIVFLQRCQSRPTGWDSVH